MKTSKILKGLGLSLSCLSLALPTSVMAGETVASQKSNAPTPVATDVALGEGGVLTGHVIDHQGAAKAETQVAVYYQSKAVATTTTDANGRFVIGGLREGSHQVASGKQVTVCRFWKSSTAPPSALSKVMLVENGAVARGQSPGGTGLLLVGGAAAAIVVGGVVSEGNSGNGGGGGGLVSP